jgi:hypothetical protein
MRDHLAVESMAGTTDTLILTGTETLALGECCTQPIMKGAILRAEKKRNRRR